MGGKRARFRYGHGRDIKFRHRDPGSAGGGLNVSTHGIAAGRPVRVGICRRRLRGARCERGRPRRGGGSVGLGETMVRSIGLLHAMAHVFAQLAQALLLMRFPGESCRSLRIQDALTFGVACGNALLAHVIPSVAFSGGGGGLHFVRAALRASLWGGCADRGSVLGAR